MSAAPRFSPLDTAFRPFFLAAGLVAALAIPAWAAVTLRGTALIDSRLVPMYWHAHEMLFGYTGAVLAGFLLTAARNWTNRPTLSGAPLGLLVLLWLGGRVVAARGAGLPALAGPIIDAAFFAGTAAAVGRAIIAARSWRNLPFPVVVLLLGVADVLLHLGLQGSVPADWLVRGLEVAVAAIALAIVLFGGRVVPMFTRNATGFATRPTGLLDRAGAGAMVAVVLATAIAPHHHATHVMAVATGALNIARLYGWGATSVLRRPILWVLHLAWLLVGSGVLLSGVAGFVDRLPPTAARHVLTVGGFGLMTLGMMARVSLGHTGRPLEVSRVIALGFGLLVVAAGARVAAALYPAHQVHLLWLAAGCWALAFGTFAVRYAGPLLTRRVDGKPG